MNRLAKICLSVGIVFILNSSFAFGMMEDDDERPPEHFCPITMSVMEDPVVAADGHSYERTAILEHFRTGGASARSPFTNLPLPNQNLLENHALRNLIQDWKPGRQSRPSEPATQDARSIAARVKEELPENAESKIAIPAVAQGHGNIYERFLKGVLVYLPPWKPGRQSGSSEPATRDARSIAARVKEELPENAGALAVAAPGAGSIPARPAPSIAIPEIARGHEDIYERFLKGVLVYRPNEGSDVGKIELPIAALANPLESTFDLSKCGDTGQYLSISTGYRKVQTPANANKVEIWFTPRFLVDKEMPHLAPNHHMRQVIRSWDSARAPIGIFWTWGGWNATDHMMYCDYLTTESIEEVGSENLFKKYQKATDGPVGVVWLGGRGNFTFRL